jgi:hypothetical protein
MNRLLRQHKDLLEETTNLRTEVLEAIGDRDLGFTPGGANPTLAELFKQQGRVQMSYITAFQTFKHEWEVRPARGLDTVSELKSWFADLDAQLISALEHLSDADLAKPIDRGGWSVPVETYFHIYREAVLIFAAKAGVYLRAMNKALPRQLEQWSG